MAGQKGKKAQMTRKRIMDSALALILEEGYEKATMRAIAKKSELSPGAAYYYFPSKEHLIHAFYERTFEVFYQRVQARSFDRLSLAENLQAVLEAQFETSAPFHEVSRVLFKAAVEPGSPLSPFSEQSTVIREKTVAIYRSIAMAKAPKALGKTHGYLPWLLWLYHMGILVFWIHDQSPGRKRTFRLIRQTTGIVARMVTMTTLPMMSKVVASGLNVLSDFDFFRKVAVGPELKT